MRKLLIILILNLLVFAGGFDDGLTVGEKVKVKHMANTHEDGVVGDTLYVYESDKREIIKDKEGVLNINNIHTDAKTLRKNGKLKVTQIEENIKVKRVSGLTKNRDILKSQERDKTEGVEIGRVDINNMNIKNVKVYRRNNQYIVKD